MRSLGGEFGLGVHFLESWFDGRAMLTRRHNKRPPVRVTEDWVVQVAAAGVAPENRRWRRAPKSHESNSVFVSIGFWRSGTCVGSHA